MNKLCTVLKQKKGMTLIEAVITFVIAGLLIGATSALIITGLNIFNDTATHSTDKQIGDSVLDTVRGRLLYAKSIEKGPEMSPFPGFYDYISQGAIFTGDGALSPLDDGEFYIKMPGDTDATNFSNENFYMNRKIGIDLTVDQVYPKKAVTIKVNVYEGADVVYSRSTSFELLNSGEFDLPSETGNWGQGTVIIYTPMDELTGG